MADPTSTAELLSWIDRDWQRLADRLAELEPADYEITGPFGWSVKDVVANIAAWERGASALLRRESRFAAMGVPETTAWDLDAINAIIWERTHQQPLAEVLAEAEAAHAELRSEVERVAWEDMAQPVSDYLPEMSGTAALHTYVAGDSYEHYAAHLPDIDAIVGAATTEATERS